MDNNRSARVVCVSSGKGGVGKTSFTVNMACALARQGKKVLLVDGDLGLANVDVALGLNVRRTMRETIDQEQPLAEIMIEIEPGFHVLPASSGVPEMAGISYEEQAFLLDALERVIDDFDFVLLDTAAGIGDSVLWFNNWADGNIVILSPDPTSMTDAYALIKVLFSRHGRDRFQLLVNNVKSRKEGLDVFTKELSQNNCNKTSLCAIVHTWPMKMKFVHDLKYWLHCWMSVFVDLWQLLKLKL